MTDIKKVISELELAMAQMCGSHYAPERVHRLINAAHDAELLLEDLNTSTERLAKATAEAENWMSKAPYLCYDLAKKLIAAAKEATHADKG